MTTIEQLQYDFRWKLADKGIDNPRLLDAFESVRRDQFVPLLWLPDGHDIEFAAPLGQGQKMTAPSLLGSMLQALEFQPGVRPNREL